MIRRALFIGLLFLWNATIWSQDFIVNSQSFGTEEGLPHREVNTIHQCSRGFVWVGTPQGLSRFDGYQFQNFNTRTDSLLHNNIWRILEDSEGWFWLLPIPPYKDFDIWHPVTRERTTFLEKFGKTQALPTDHPTDWIMSNNNQTLIAKLDAHTLFTYHADQGVQIIDLEGIELFDQVQVASFGKATIAADKSIWLTTANNEVVEIDWKGQILQRFQHDTPLHFNSSIHNHAFPFVYFEWIGIKTTKKKSYLIDRDGRRHILAEEHWYPSILPGLEKPTIGEDILYDDFAFYRKNGEHLFSLHNDSSNEASSNYRTFIFTNQGDLWTGDDFGLQKISIRKNIFKNYLTGQNGQFNPIRGIFANNEHIILNVEHLGPFVLDRAEGQMPLLKYSGEDFGAFAIRQLRDKRITFGLGLALHIIEDIGSQKTSIRTFSYIWSIFQVSPNTLWLGTDKGLSLFDLSKNEIRPFEKYNGFNDLRTTFITHIESTLDGSIWLCTNKGFFQADPENGILAQYSKSGKGQFQIPNDVIYHFYEEEDGIFWLASGGSGLLRLMMADGQLTEQTVHRQFTTLDGLSNDVIYAVYPDDFGNLWLSSDQGIMQFNKNTSEVKTFLIDDGLPNNEFNRLAHFQKSDGELFFGTINGAISFYPEDLAGMESHENPPLQITNYQQFDGKQNRLTERTTDLLRDLHITLHPNDRFFRLEMALLNFEDVSKNHFAYRFTGMGDEWEYTSERTLRFGRLPYGEYELQIKGQDARGHWSTSELHIPVTVLRPFFLQTWFLILVGTFVLVSGFLFLKWRVRTLKRRQTELEHIVNERTHQIQTDKKTIEQQAEELKSLEKLKSRFFANVSHELRTPLTLMLGPIDKLKKGDLPKEKSKRLVDFIHNNSTHLLKLVNEILDLSKLETDRLEIKETDVNFYEFLQPLVAQFSSFGDSESVRLIVEYHADKNLTISIDTGKFEKIVHNFLSNAIKFTPFGGTVKLIIEDHNDQLLVKVTDTGTGIHPDDLPHVFDRFYQSKQPDAPTQGGTGIGLSLCKELAELLDGRIWAESELGKGSIFYFEFPKKLSVFGRQLSVDSSFSAALSPKGEPPPAASKLEESRLKETGSGFPLETEGMQDPKHTIDNRQLTTLLIVEDNPELREYMSVLLGDTYNIITAENGKIAWELLTVDRDDNSQSTFHLPPSLIISDLMMPVMDGFQFLEKVKAHDKFRHIPVIMLTARADVRVKLRALRIGVDDYLTKPFVEEELQVRIKNLLLNYEERVEFYNFQKVEQPDSEIPVMAAVDTEWLEEVEKNYLGYINDSRLNSDFIADKMFLSERQFRRRLKQLTGLTPNNYLREIRLQVARDFLHEGKYISVKEVSAAIGFSSTKYFSNLFHERFGVLPSEYIR